MPTSSGMLETIYIYIICSACGTKRGNRIWQVHSVTSVTTPPPSTWFARPLLKNLTLVG